MNRAKNIFIALAAVAAMMFVAPIAQARQVIALLFENGIHPMIFHPDGTVTGKLFCEGDIECGTVKFTNLTPIQVDAQTYDFDTTVTVCQGDSCVAAQNARFLGHSIPQIAAEVPGAVVFQFTMVSHDPIVCGDTSGMFAPPGCAGNLKLDYRCLAEVDTSTKQFVATRGSAYVISTGD